MKRHSRLLILDMRKAESDECEIFHPYRDDRLLEGAYGREAKLFAVFQLLVVIPFRLDKHGMRSGLNHPLAL